MRRALATSGLVLAASTALAGGGVYRRTSHGDAVKGVLRLDSEPRGECAQCHDPHASRGGTSTGGPYPYLLFRANDTALCGTCHDAASPSEVYPGAAPWASSSHALSSVMVWPGPQPRGRPNDDAGKCVNCHDPHGNADAAGLIPSQAHTREQELCLPCHDGSPAPDVRAPFNAPFRHPIGTAGRHLAGEGGDSARFGGANRHAECNDCHNPHRVARDAVAPRAPAASSRVAGVSRVKVSNGAPGTRPVYTWVGAGDLAFPAEYEVCFKCHSSWTTQPAGQSDLAVLLNPNNASYHPVQEPGKNRNIDPLAFVNGWTWDRLTYCSDCHGSDDTAVRGPHGSQYRSILKKDYAASSAPAPMAADDLCFQCHAWNTYANPAATDAEKRASRFNTPAASGGHTFHVALQGYTCYACHQSHGSVLRPALIATGRSPGVTAYTQASGGGACAATCHVSRTYAANYAR